MRTLPVVAMRGSVVFPNTDSFLSFGRNKSVLAVNSAFADDRVVAIFNQKDPKVSDPALKDLYKVGTIATITQMMTNEDDIHALIRGTARVRLEELVSTDPYLVAKVTQIAEEETEEGPEIVALAGEVAEMFRKAVNLGKGVDVPTIMRILSRQAGPVEIVDSVASFLDISAKEKQKLLETFSVRERLEKVVEYLSHEVNVLDLERLISLKTQKRFEDQMKKAMLREKKRTIEKELGEEEKSEEDSEISELKKKIKAAKMPSEAEKKAFKELKRLRKLPPYSPETGYLRNYLEWLVDVPWTKRGSKSVSVKKAAKTLNTDHYGLDKAKERILEYLAVLKLKNAKKEDQSHPTILCFVGPPGVGKTSIGKSIAKALDREFVRVSLGGIRDEAEIRGHRRTYVGAMPGRIIQSIKNAGTNNPVFMLDEVDKIGSDYRGDPSSALLEILDPEQNKEFSDHYLEVPYDLSNVMFICTANVLETIPEPLRDRMEIIKFAGYIEEEKFNIAKKYLWPKQTKANGISGKNIKITDQAIKEIIKYYTREAGVRNLERALASVARKVAREISEGKRFPKLIKGTHIHKYLGARRFKSQIKGEEDEIGMSTGLAVTSTGGEILFVEVSLMPGKGKLTLTGQLGDVMKESAKAAFTWTRSHWKELGLREDFGRSLDVHIHVPEGATPKDGPSAGIAMATALTSALTRIPVKRDVGMTGEITLRGRALEIGGVKEKVIAGHRAGLKTIILPEDNKKDMEEVPDNVKKDIEFIFVGKLEDALEHSLVRSPSAKTKNGRKAAQPPAFIASA